MDYCGTLDTPMATFRNSFFDMVTLLLHFIQSTREGNWSLHVTCIRDMIPWLFAYDRRNYARFLPVYWSKLMQLEQVSHPEAHAKFSNGEFAVQKGQTIEETLNRAMEISGGSIGFSLNKGAVHRWNVIAHEPAAMRGDCFKIAGMKESGTSYRNINEYSMKCYYF